MIIKVTVDNVLFSWAETDKDIEWCEGNTNLPVSVNAIVKHYMQQNSNEWYKNNIGSQMWYHLKK
jgi:hypothetical protein